MDIGDPGTQDRVVMDVLRVVRGPAPPEPFTFTDAGMGCGALSGNAVGSYVRLAFGGPGGNYHSVFWRYSPLSPSDPWMLGTSSVVMMDAATPGLHGVVVENGGSASVVAYQLPMQPAHEVQALWAMIDGVWRYALAAFPNVEGGLRQFPDGLIAAYAVLS